MRSRKTAIARMQMEMCRLRQKFDLVIDQTLTQDATGTSVK